MNKLLSGLNRPTIIQLAISLLFISLCACSGSKEERKYDGNITFHFDTVHVDANEEIIFLKQNMRVSALSPDKKHMVNFNFYDHTLEVINLDDLILEKKIPFEKEGPNGTGDRIQHIQYFGRDSLYISTETEYAFFNFEGTKTGFYPRDPLKYSGSDLNEFEKFMVPIIYVGKPELVVGMSRDYGNKTLAFLKKDLKEKTIHRLDLPEFQGFKNFHFTLDQPKIIATPTAFTSSSGSIVLFSVEYTNDIYAYDIYKDNLTHIANEHQLIPNRKDRMPPQELADLQEFQQVNNMLKEQITFTPPIWDDENKVFYRFSHMEYDLDEEFTLNPTSKSHVFLSILDPELKLISEHPIETMQKPPIRPFVRNGMIWYMENIEDELAFVRITLE